MGQSISVANNAKLLGIDLAAAPIALGHGHCDHTGGLACILEKTGPRTALCHPNVFSTKYVEMHGMIRPIGIPESRKNLERLGADFNISKQARQIGERTWLTGEIPRITDYEKPENYLLIMDPIKGSIHSRDNRRSFWKRRKDCLSSWDAPMPAS